MKRKPCYVIRRLHYPYNSYIMNFSSNKSDVYGITVDAREAFVFDTEEEAVKYLPTDGTFEIIKIYK